MEHLFNQLVRPSLRTFVSDVYKDISYMLDEDAYATAEYNDLVKKRFIKAWGNAMDGYKVRPSIRVSIMGSDSLLGHPDGE